MKSIDPQSEDIDYSSSPNAPKTVEHSKDFLAEIVGEESRAGERIQAGPVLKLMYGAVVAVAEQHCGFRPVMLRLDRLDLTGLICHMDLVHIEGRLVEVGRTTLVVEVRCFAKKPAEREFSPCNVGFVTMVAINEQGQPVRAIPPLSLDSPQGREAQALAAHRQAQLKERHHALEWIEQRKSLRVEDVKEPEPFERYDMLRPEETTVRVKGQIFSPGAQGDGRVRAGDLLVWLDRVATYTARHFTRNEHVVTLSINDVIFRKPLHASDRIELIARVVYVRSHTLEVSIDIIVHTLDGAQYALDSVDFFILNHHPSGEKQKITTGLALTHEDQDSLKRFLKARTRFNFWKSNPDSHLIQTPV